MKKIVALALCLIMALSLATVAFAAGYSGDSLADANTAAGGVITSALRPGTPAYSNTDGKFLQVYYIDTTNTVNKTVTSGNDAYVKAAKLYTNGMVYVEGTTITYLAPAPSTALATVSKVATKEIGDTLTCGDIIVDGDADLYVNVAANGTKSYYSTKKHGTATWFECGDLAICLYPCEAGAVSDVAANGDGDKFYKEAHQYVATTTKDSKGTETVATLTCKTCKATFAFEMKEKNAMAKFGVGGYEAVTDPTNYNGTIYVKTAAGTTAAEGVTSAKTFDAGVALYAGMALMSVAGSAVVIGKKKEF